MSGERLRRERLERAQARLARAKAKLAAPPDVEAALACLRDDEAKLHEALQSLLPRAAASAAELSALKAELARTRGERGAALTRSLSHGLVGVLASLGAAAVGGVTGGLLLFLAWDASPSTVPVVSVAGGVLAAWVGYRVGRES